MIASKSAHTPLSTPKSAYLLSSFVIVLSVVASAGGLFLENLYRDNLWASTQFRGSDLVRLVIVAPVFVTALVLAMRDSLRARLVWLGMLWLTAYDYAFYLFGAAFNAFFLIYVALFSLSVLALIFGVPSVDAARAKEAFDKAPVTWVSGYLLLVALFLGGLWTAQSLGFAFGGALPQSIIDSGIHTNIVFALDLSLLVPGMVLAALWLLQRRPWGYVLAAMMMVKGTLYPLALIGMSVFYARATGSWDAMTGFWVFFALASLVFTLLFFGRKRGDARALA